MCMPAVDSENFLVWIFGAKVTQLRAVKKRGKKKKIDEQYLKTSSQDLFDGIQDFTCYKVDKKQGRVKIKFPNYVKVLICYIIRIIFANYGETHTV